MKIWKNTNTLDDYDEGLNFTENYDEASIALMGSKKIQLDSFSKLKGIFRAGIGKDNVPEAEAIKKGIIIKYPSKETINIIYNETAAFTCSLIFKMLYSDLGTIKPWKKYDRLELSKKNLLVIGLGNIGQRVVKYMSSFMFVSSFDIINNNIDELKKMINRADCITIHIPKSKSNINFFDEEKLSLMKDHSILINTSRASIVDEISLYKEIKSNRLRAAFDVFWEEPYYGVLTEFDPYKFLMSPHVASTCVGFLKGCRKDLDNMIKELYYD